MRTYIHLSAALLLAAGINVAQAASEMSIQVRTAQLRAAPNFLAKPVATADYAERVTIIETRGEWVNVHGAKGNGWIHTSSLTEKKIALKAGAENVESSASGKEMALAYKGFNSDVEADFKGKNPNIDFSPIDRMEKIKVSQDEARTFLSEGGVQGGAR